jgi:hypothetical protein
LSWWCKQIFSEFHFVWEPRFRQDILEKVKPNFVIGQTVERFLHVVPES